MVNCDTFTKMELVLVVAILQILLQSEQAYGTCVDGFLPDAVIQYIFDTDTDGEPVFVLCPSSFWDQSSSSSSSSSRPSTHRHHELRALRSRDSPEYQFLDGAFRLIERAYPSRHQGLLDRFETAFFNGRNGYLDWNSVTGRSYTQTVAWVSGELISAARITGDNREFNRLFSVATSVAYYRQSALRRRNRNRTCDEGHQYTLDAWNQLALDMAHSDVGRQIRLSCSHLYM